MINMNKLILLGIVTLPSILSPTPNWLTNPTILETQCTKSIINASQVIYTCEVP